MTTVSAVTQIEELSKRQERAREIVGEGHVSPVVGKDGQYVVQALARVATTWSTG